MTDDLIRNLVTDWLRLRALPVPKPDDGPKPKVVEYGHPAQWASDKADEIARLLAELQTTVWGAEVHYGLLDNLAHDSQTRIGAAGFTKLAEYFLDPDNGIGDVRPSLELIDPELLSRLEGVHREVDRELGMDDASRSMGELPCPACSQKTLVYRSEADEVRCESCHYSNSDAGMAEIMGRGLKAVTQPHTPVTIRYAANFFGVPYKKIEKWVERGKLDRLGRDKKGRVLIDKEEVQKLLAPPPP